MYPPQHYEMLWRIFMFYCVETTCVKCFLIAYLQYKFQSFFTVSFSLQSGNGEQCRQYCHAVPAAAVL